MDFQMLNMWNHGNTWEKHWKTYGKIIGRKHCVMEVGIAGKIIKLNGDLVKKTWFAGKKNNV